MQNNRIAFIPVAFLAAALLITGFRPGAAGDDDEPAVPLVEEVVVLEKEDPAGEVESR